ncbi:ArsR family transcriptional regulator [Streptomyces luteolus]|uniref:ArsR family transcriptional regulator n=1 Tax=Streptomyces luteolus TaxID=3043615 RepID=A0ABT6T737_9ACTN|nr:ArsR family transcriptional regulator [Streptomyces sp. B-S-A12]MDI3422682.1 ArsR family transcriptional regulator [Streptomyces sp. B-S-A12]
MVQGTSLSLVATAPLWRANPSWSPRPPQGDLPALRPTPRGGGCSAAARARPRLVGEIAYELERSQPRVSKHLRVLREGRARRGAAEAQRRWYELRPDPLPFSTTGLRRIAGCGPNAWKCWSGTWKRCPRRTAGSDGRGAVT